MFACQQNGYLVPGKMEICCIIENLASIKTRIHRKTIEGLHDIFHFFCFMLGKYLSLSNRDTFLRDPLFSISQYILHIFLYTTQCCADGDKRPCNSQVSVYRTVGPTVVRIFNRKKDCTKGISLKFTIKVTEKQ